MRRTGNRVKAGSKGGRLLTVILALSAPALAQSTATKAIAGIGTRPRRLILVSIPDRKLAVLENDAVVRTFPVAVGTAESPSPTGEFQIVSRYANPTYYHEGVLVPPGSDNPVGPRWVGLNKKGYGIHGTNRPHSIGKAASHGCIRLNNRDVTEFFELVSVGDTVEIRDGRDDQVARVFGTAPEAQPRTTAPAQPVALAQAQTAGLTPAGGQ